jgi:hypothetical protein
MADIRSLKDVTGPMRDLKRIVIAVLHCPALARESTRYGPAPSLSSCVCFGKEADAFPGLAKRAGSPVCLASPHATFPIKATFFK